VYQVRNPELLRAVLLYLQKMGVEVVEGCEVTQLFED